MRFFALLFVITVYTADMVNGKFGQTVISFLTKDMKKSMPNQSYTLFGATSVIQGALTVFNNNFENKRTFYEIF